MGRKEYIGGFPFRQLAYFAITIPGLTLFFGSRLLHFSACAAAKACDEKEQKRR
jgi:uncharacterized membrane protein YesL